MRYISVFSGVEAATVAWEPLGWEPVAFCEVDAFPSAVLAQRFPDVPNLGDITKVDWKEVLREHGAVDLLVGGSPCQSFSVAGKREGLAGASGLMFEYVRAVREIRPRWVVWENVPGALSSEGGEAFRCLLSELDALGYGLAWRVLDAQFFGVAQRRERVFVVGSLGTGRSADVLFESDGLRWDFEAGREKRQALASRAEGSAGASSTLQVRCGCAGGGKGALVQRELSATLSCSNVQTLFQPSYGFKYHQGAKAGNIGFEEEQSPTLMADGHHPPAALVNTVVIDRAAFNQGVNAQYPPPHRDGGRDGHARSSRPSCGRVRGGCVPMSDYIVRKLTPRECERLQGFPDDWTRIEWRGKQSEDCPDSPRYKAMGNSMAVPVMRWIGERIELADRMPLINDNQI